jgi:uncharacterized membrane protein YhiD involved in acid resistance
VTVDISQLSDLLAQLAMIAATITAAALWIRRRMHRWVSSIAADAKQAATQLTPSNGRTVAQITEATEARMVELAERADQNRDLGMNALAVAQQALSLAQHVDSRMDRHLLYDHHGDTTTQAPGVNGGAIA